MDALFKPHIEILEILIRKEVNFMLIGGYSVIHYGYKRGTNDMDIWLQPENKNKLKLTEAMREYGLRKSEVQKILDLDFTKAQAFFLGEDPARVDFVTNIQSVTWNEAIPNVRFIQTGALMIPVIGYHDLIRTKISSRRLKDLADVEELQKINRNRNN